MIEVEFPVSQRQQHCNNPVDLLTQDVWHTTPTAAETLDILQLNQLNDMFLDHTHMCHSLPAQSCYNCS
jgi:hypothetical protein